MTDIGEPPSKVTKFEMESQYLEGEVMDEGQEEWLSEGILTDDDYPAPEDESNLNASLDNSVPSADASMENSQHYEQAVSDMAAGSIEETLNNLEKDEAENNNQNQSFPEELETFLVRKTNKNEANTQSTTHKQKTSTASSRKQSEDDGNDTDDLLRMLGDNNDRTNKNSKRNAESSDGDDDDDDYIFGGAKMKQVSKNTILTKKPTRAEPEDDGTDMSSDEGDTMKKMFNIKAHRKANATSSDGGNRPSLRSFRPQGKTVRHVVDVNRRPAVQNNSNRSNPLKQYANKKLTQSPAKIEKKQENVREKEEIINEDEFTEGDHIDLDEKFAEKEHKYKEDKIETLQRIMKPEQMDEEVPTDAESDSDGDSLYDELPSSDSENLDEWFTLDIRAERAGDYIPLLGDRAYKLLSEEKARVETRLHSLKTSLSALGNSGKEQSEQLRQATHALAELDAMLKAV